MNDEYEMEYTREDELLERITELEKSLAISEHDREHNDYELTEVYKKVEQLKKENADLREELTETKRLLARWIDDRPYTVSEQKDLIADTEQFLKECE